MEAAAMGAADLLVACTGLAESQVGAKRRRTWHVGVGGSAIKLLLWVLCHLLIMVHRSTSSWFSCMCVICIALKESANQTSTQ
jgi:hypothetical protein